MIRYFLDAQGGFTVCDTVSGATSYAYPTSTYATGARKSGARVAREMIAQENVYRDDMGDLIHPWVADKDRAAFVRIGDARLSSASGYGEI